MRLVKCPACSSPLSPQAVACPRCGHPIEDNKPLPYAKAAAVGVVIFLLLGLVGSMFDAIRAVLGF